MANSISYIEHHVCHSHVEIVLELLWCRAKCTLSLSKHDMILGLLRFRWQTITN